jgi:integrase
MPRQKEPPRLKLNPGDRGRKGVWIIKDGKVRKSTGCVQSDHRGAEEALARYLAGKFEAPQGVRPTELLIGEVVTAYLKEHAAHSPYLGTRRFLAKTATLIMDWWTDKTWAQVNAPNCRKYMTWRRARLKRNGKQVSDQTVRHELTTLQSALSWYSREYAPLVVVPKVTRPPPTPPKLDYFLERDDVAARIRAARRLGYDRIVRLLLIGAYTGTRPGATMALRWLPSPSDGWVDLDGCILWRKGTRALESKKRRTPCRIHRRLLRHLKHWRDADMAAGIIHIINYGGEPITEMRKSWRKVREEASRITGKPAPTFDDKYDAPHVMRHTAATWMRKRGCDQWRLRPTWVCRSRPTNGSTLTWRRISRQRRPNSSRSCEVTRARLHHITKCPSERTSTIGGPIADRLT